MYDFLIMPWAIPVISGCAVAVVAIIVGSIKSALTALAETSLKQSMVEQGFSAAEIERVVLARSQQDGKPCFSSSDKPLATTPRHSKQAV